MDFDTIKKAIDAGGTTLLICALIYLLYQVNKERQRFLEIIMTELPKNARAMDKLRWIIQGKRDPGEEE